MAGKPSKITDEIIQKLEDLVFVWNPGLAKIGYGNKGGDGGDSDDSDCENMLS